MWTKIVALFKFLKAGSYDKMMDAILPLLFENKVVKVFLEKNKTVIGFILETIALILELAEETFPSEPWIPMTLACVGVVLQALGIAHRGVKERRELQVVEAKRIS